MKKYMLIAILMIATITGWSQKTFTATHLTKMVYDSCTEEVSTVKEKDEEYTFVFEKHFVNLFCEKCFIKTHVFEIDEDEKPWVEQLDSCTKAICVFVNENKDNVKFLLTLAFDEETGKMYKIALIAEDASKMSMFSGVEEENGQKTKMPSW